MKYHKAVMGIVQKNNLLSSESIKILESVTEENPLNEDQKLAIENDMKTRAKEMYEAENLPTIKSDIQDKTYKRSRTKFRKSIVKTLGLTEVTNKMITDLEDDDFDAKINEKIDALKDGADKETVLELNALKIKYSDVLKDKEALEESKEQEISEARAEAKIETERGLAKEKFLAKLKSKLDPSLPGRDILLESMTDTFMKNTSPSRDGTIKSTKGDGIFLHKGGQRSDNMDEYIDTVIETANLTVQSSGSDMPKVMGGGTADKTKSDKDKPKEKSAARIKQEEKLAKAKTAKGADKVERRTSL